ncbi:Protein of unknown function [Aliiroseovarius halocynthiae]|uniref:DUF1499 domain-containing protein n=1 Tax=Aliiroseovarius halocynthiae TaxID=985055 RepID=A0A545SWK1_9RHOB|nr:DUF1499 domain-containing protein [Aliiroseovarius halocynthiae]TQV69341.1 DUF1499 domain-containing protein [Aliiroseovarius halocynthiae]SMR72269.1 Protein of unknown function [Aliiroseovarius halocynthiae]
MKLTIWIFAAMAVLAALLAIYARLRPLEPARFSDQPGPMEPGVHTLRGGVKYVIPLSELSEDALARLLDIVRQTPRTTEVATNHGHSFVTRSRGFGFPDVTRIWQADGNLHIYAHLVIGKSDLGVNGVRVGQWDKALRGSLR